MAVQTTTLTPKAVDASVKKHFVDAYKQLEPKIDIIYKVGNQENKTDVMQNYAGLEGYEEVAENASYNEDTMIQSYGVSLTPVKFGKLFGVTLEMRRFAKTKDIIDGAKALGKAAARKLAARAAEIFNKGFDTSFTSYTDGKPLFSTQHPRADGGTALSNASDTGLALNAGNLDLAVFYMSQQLDDRGEMINVAAQQLVVPQALKSTALVLTKSEGKPGTANNDINVYYGAMQVIVVPHIGNAAGGSNTAWFLLDPQTHRLIWQWVDKPLVEKSFEKGWDKDTLYYKGRFWASRGWADWRGTWGSKGDGATYSS